MIKINFLGDSITQGAAASSIENTYVAKVGVYFPCIARNYGLGGSRIAKQIGNEEPKEYDHNFYERAQQMDKDADFVFIFGGTNDHGHGNAPLGTSEDNTEYTFCGALNILLAYLTKEYGNNKLCYILPLHKYDENNPLGEGRKKVPGPIMKDYNECIKNACNKYGVDILCLDEEFPTPKTRQNELYSDGLHPNDHGHDVLAKAIVKYLHKIGF